MPTLEESMTKYLTHAARKHDLGDSYVEDAINQMNNYDFMKALSDAIEDMKNHGSFK